MRRFDYWFWPQVDRFLAESLRKTVPGQFEVRRASSATANTGESDMQRIHQGTAFFFLAFSVFVVWESWNLEYYTALGPGAGFFPLWLGAIMGGLSLIWLAQVSGGKGKPKEGAFLPGREGSVRLLSVLVALVATALFMDMLGFQLPMFLLLVFLLGVVGQQKIWLTLVIALLGSVGIYHLFGSYLDVQLPKASLAFLASLGL
jgi:putative tricarboxylic transport membrane protein